MMGGACHPHGGEALAKTSAVWRTPALQEKSGPSKEAVQKDTVKANLQGCKLKPKELEESTSDRSRR